MARVAGIIQLTNRQEKLLKGQVRSHKIGQSVATRMRIILLAAKGLQNVQIAQKLDVDSQRVARWRKRWVSSQNDLAKAEAKNVSDKDYLAMVWGVLGDSARPGGPPKFEAKQIAGIIKIACEEPQDSGYPVTHWTPKEIRAEAIKRGLVESISVRQVDRFLKRSRLEAA